MAIIRNERSSREEPVQVVGDTEEELEIDYSWHPHDDEFVSPLTAEQWQRLLSDPTFAESDAARAVRCLYEYDGPATFQQLSIRYRGTMGRYRRWLAEAAQMAGDRYGVPAPQKDQFGMDEWWPLLYLTRNTGKPGAGVFEMQLRPEVEQAFELIAEEERQAKRAENARNLKRIEQLERARQEERQRRAAAAQAAEAQATESTQQVRGQLPALESAQVAGTGMGPIDAGEVASSPSASFSAMADKGPAGTGTQSLDSLGAGAAPESQPTNAAADKVANELPVPTPPIDLPATRSFLELVSAQEPSGGARFVVPGMVDEQVAFDMAAPLDYALRYAERLRHAFQRMSEGIPQLTLAAIARELGDESVERLQAVCNGQDMPSFAYLDAMRDRLFLNIERLEVREGSEDDMPVFRTLHDVAGTDGVLALLAKGPREVAYVVDDSASRRTGVIVRFSDLSCALLTNVAVEGVANPTSNGRLAAFIAMVDELDDFARTHGVARTSRQVGAQSWERVASGSAWPGTLLR